MNLARIQLECHTTVFKPCASDNDVPADAGAFLQNDIVDFLRLTADEDAALANPDMGGVYRIHFWGDVVCSVLTEASGQAGGGLEQQEEGVEGEEGHG